MPDINLNHYIVRKILAPSGSGLTSGAVALAVRNISGAQLMCVEVAGQTLFTGTNAASGSLWGIQRVTGTPASGTVLTPFKCHPNGLDPATVMEVRFSDTGTITGVSANGQDAYHLGVASQVGASEPIPQWLDFENPIVLAPNDVLLVYAATAIVAGSRATVGLRFFRAAS